MATVHSTGKGRSSRQRSSSAARRLRKDGSNIGVGGDTGGYSLPTGVIDAIEEQRLALGVALSLLTGLEAGLLQIEEDSGDILDEVDAGDALVLKARRMARPIDLVRLAMQRVYQAQEKLDSLYLERASRDAK